MDEVQRTADERAYRVLVVDDDPIALRSLQYTLSGAGFSVWCLGGPIGVSQLVFKHDIDVLILDLFMPGMRGDRVVEMLRQNRRLGSLPVLIVSGEQGATVDSKDVSVIPKARVARELVPKVRAMAMQHRQSRVNGPSCDEGPANDTRSDEDDQPMLRESGVRIRDAAALELGQAREALLKDFLHKVPSRIARVTQFWDRACAGGSSELERVRGELHQLKGESQLLGQEGLAMLVERTEAAVRVVRPARPVPVPLAAAVRASLNALVRMARAGGDRGGVDTQIVLTRLDGAREQCLRGDHQGTSESSAIAGGLLKSLIPPKASGDR